MVGACLGVPTLNGSASPTVLTDTQVEREFIQRTWRQADGLPDGRVQALLQTHDGYLWLGTEQGLVRFDGEHFTVFDHVNTPALVKDDCRLLAEDAEGSLWIGTSDGLVHEVRGRFIRVIPAAAGKRWISDWIESLCASRLGGVWVGSDDSLARIDSRGAKAYGVKQGLPMAPVVALEEDADGLLWVGTWAGLYRFDPKTETCEPARVPTGFERRPVFGFRQDQHGELWVLFGEHAPPVGPGGLQGWLAGYKNGRWVEAPDPRREEFRFDQRSRFVAGDPWGAIWLPGTGKGLLRFARGQFQSVPLPRFSAKEYGLCALSGREGNLWIGTDSETLQSWTPRAIVTYTAQDGLPNDNVRSVYHACDGSLWIGTDGGLSHFKNGEFTNLTRRDGLAQNEVRAVTEDAGGTLWVGTLNGLDSIRDGKITHHRFPGEWYETKIRALLTDRDGALWVATVCGLTRLDHGQRRKYTKADGLGSNEPRALLEDRSGDLWIGTLGGGLSRFHDGKFTTLTTTNGLSSNNVWALFQDREGVLWIGTDNGLDRLADGRITAFTTRDGLPDNEVDCILEDDFGRLWVSDDRGLYSVPKADFSDLAAGRISRLRAVSYDQSDGLVTTQFNGQMSSPTGCKTRDGRLWFPTMRGVAVIDPSKVVREEVPPMTVIEEVRANGRVVMDNGPQTAPLGQGPRARADDATPGSSVGTRGQLAFGPGAARILEFHYTANTFTASQRARFKYRLLGLDDHWVDSGTRREAYFTDLAPGDYTFEVKACNHRGVWAEGGATLAFDLAPFYYQTWWFYMVCGVGLFGAVFGVGTWRVRELRKIHRLEYLHGLDQQRQRIARDIHDDLGASLAQILQLSGEMPESQDPSDPAQAGNHNRRIASLAEEAVAHIAEIVWANNPKYDTLEDLVAYLREYAARFLEATPIQGQFDFPEAVPDRIVTGLFRRHLLLLVKEGLQNVIKHAGAHHVRLRLALPGERLELTISDDGRGLADAEGSARGNGLPNMRYRVSELNGSFDLRSAPGQGTEIRIDVPLPPQT